MDATVLARQVVASTGHAHGWSQCTCTQGTEYRSIQIDYRQTFFSVSAINSNCRYRIVLPEELVSITETDLWKYQQKSLITGTDSPLNSSSFPLQIQTSASKWMNSVIISATTVSLIWLRRATPFVLALPFSPLTNRRRVLPSGVFMQVCAQLRPRKSPLQWLQRVSHRISSIKDVWTWGGHKSERSCLVRGPKVQFAVCLCRSFSSTNKSSDGTQMWLCYRDVTCTWINMPWTSELNHDS